MTLRSVTTVIRVSKSARQYGYFCTDSPGPTLHSSCPLTGVVRYIREVWGVVGPLGTRPSSGRPTRRRQSRHRVRPREGPSAEVVRRKQNVLATVLVTDCPSRVGSGMCVCEWTVSTGLYGQSDLGRVHETRYRLNTSVFYPFSPTT